jgi:hypothetical protein
VPSRRADWNTSPNPELAFSMVYPIEFMRK